MKIRRVLRPCAWCRGSRARLDTDRLGKLRYDLVRRVAEAGRGTRTANWGKWYVETQGKSLTYSICLQSWQHSIRAAAILHKFICSPMRGTEKKARNASYGTHTELLLVSFEVDMFA